MKKNNTRGRRAALTAAEHSSAERDLRRLRARIDRTDRAIVIALMQRSRLVLEIAALKAKAKLGGVDVPRERAILDNIEAHRQHPDSAETRGYSRSALRRIYRTLLDESRRLL